MLDPYLGGDPVFGRMNGTAIEDFLDPKLVAHAKSAIVNIERGLILIVGTGAFLVSPDPSVLIYADMARWEIQRRQRQNLIANLGVSNEVESASLKYKRAFFVDWRAADRLKKQLLPSIDFLLDTNDSGCHKMISGATLRAGLKKVVGQPFRLVPYFDPGPWGGQAGNPPTDECSSSDTGLMINEYNGVWMDEGPEILLLTSFCSRRALRLGPYFPTY